MQAKSRVALAVLMVVGHSSLASDSPFTACGGGLPSGVVGQLVGPPTDAPLLREIADKHLYFHAGGPPFQTEIWVSLGDTTLMLCRAGSRRDAYVVGEWWKFSTYNSSRLMLANSGWVLQPRGG